MVNETYACWLRKLLSNVTWMSGELNAEPCGDIVEAAHQDDRPFLGLAIDWGIHHAMHGCAVWWPSKDANKNTRGYFGCGWGQSRMKDGREDPHPDHRS